MAPLAEKLARNTDETPTKRKFEYDRKAAKKKKGKN